ncbi:MAG: helix-turn-helix domain-containing protein [Oscillospiraceae bacterium]|nr:helix-turn-helix domain-containing protein [Oscillospiraceae bacterium]
MNRILELREKAGLNQAEFANKIGISPNDLSSWERGEAEPDNDSIVKLASYFEVTIDFLLGQTACACPFCGAMYDMREDVSCPHCLSQARG